MSAAAMVKLDLVEPAREPQLRVVCAWKVAPDHQEVIKAGDPGARESHGMCKPCAAHVRAERAAKRDGFVQDPSRGWKDEEL